MRVTFPIIRTLAYAVLVFFMWRFVGMQALRFDAKLSFTLPGWTTAIGIPLLIAGVVLTTISLAEFALIGKGTFVHFDPPKEFIASGVYKFSRNPMYLGVLLIFIASGLVYHSVSLLILSLPLFCSLISWLYFLKSLHCEINLGKVIRLMKTPLDDGYQR